MDNWWPRHAWPNSIEKVKGLLARLLIGSKSVLFWIKVEKLALPWNLWGFGAMDIWPLLGKAKNYDFQDQTGNLIIWTMNYILNRFDDFASIWFVCWVQFSNLPKRCKRVCRTFWERGECLKGGMARTYYGNGSSFFTSLFWKKPTGTLLISHKMEVQAGSLPLIMRLKLIVQSKDFTRKYQNFFDFHIPTENPLMTGAASLQRLDPIIRLTNEESNNPMNFKNGLNKAPKSRKGWIPNRWILCLLEIFKICIWLNSFFLPCRKLYFWLGKKAQKISSILFCWRSWKKKKKTKNPSGRSTKSRLNSHIVMHINKIIPIQKN